MGGGCFLAVGKERITGIEWAGHCSRQATLRMILPQIPIVPPERSTGWDPIPLSALKHSQQSPPGALDRSHLTPWHTQREKQLGNVY